MQPFKFKYEKILNLKEKTKKQIEIEFMNANNNLIQEQEKLNKLKKDYSGYERQLKKTLNSKIDLVHINFYKNALKYLENEINNQTKTIEELEEKVNKIKAELVKIMQEVKMFEKLKEKALEEYKMEYNRNEDKEINDFINFKYNNKQDE